MQRGSDIPEPTDGLTAPDRSKRRGYRVERGVRRYFGTDDREPQEERLDRRSNNRESEEDDGDPGANPDARESRDVDPGPKEEHHTYHESCIADAA